MRHPSVSSSSPRAAETARGVPGGALAGAPFERRVETRQRVGGPVAGRAAVAVVTDPARVATHEPQLGASLHGLLQLGGFRLQLLRLGGSQRPALRAQPIGSPSAAINRTSSTWRVLTSTSASNRQL